MEATPIDLREVFARPWEGPATNRLPWWLRWVPFLPKTYHFRTEIEDVELAETTGLTVRDTTTWSNGQVWERTMNARLVGPGHWRITAEDMRGTIEQHAGPDGFAFDPYTVRAPVLGPIRVPLRCHDESVLVDETTLVNTIRMRFLGVHVGTITMTLRRT